MSECPMCFTEACLLGTLGDRAHFRCPACGLDHSTPAEGLDLADLDLDDDSMMLEGLL